MCAVPHYNEFGQEDFVAQLRILLIITQKGINDLKFKKETISMSPLRQSHVSRIGREGWSSLEARQLTKMPKRYFIFHSLIFPIQFQFSYLICKQCVCYLQSFGGLQEPYRLVRVRKYHGRLLNVECREESADCSGPKDERNPELAPKGSPREIAALG